MKEILFFSSPWCGPCIQMKKDLTDSIRTELNIKEIDISKEIDLAVEYNVFSVPMFVILKDGKERLRKLGKVSIEELKNY